MTSPLCGAEVEDALISPRLASQTPLPFTLAFASHWIRSGHSFQIYSWMVYEGLLRMRGLASGRCVTVGRSTKAVIRTD